MPPPAVEADAHEALGVEAPPPATQPRLTGFDGLRALAATLIVVHHAGFASGATFRPWIGPFLARMDVGVPIFFAISGFLLYRPFVAATFAGDAPPDRLAFWWRRGLRIYPAYWVALVVQLVAGGIVVLGVGGFLWTATLTHIYDLGLPARSVTGISQSWSLATELSFYAVLPFWAARVHRRVRVEPANRVAARLLAWLLLWVVVSFAFRIAVQAADPAWAGNSWLWLPALADLFAMGMALAVVSVWAGHSPTVARFAQRVGRSVLPCWLGALGLFWFVSTQLDLVAGLDRASLPRELVRQTIYGLIGLLLVAPLALAPGRRDRVRRILDSRVLSTLGVLSYGIYIWHQLFIGKLREWLGWGVFDGHFPETLVLAYLLSVAAAYASYRLVEHPVSRLRGAVRSAREPRPDGPAVADPVPEPVPEPVSDPQTEPVELGAPQRPSRFRARLALVALGGLVVRAAYVLVVRRDVALAGDPYWYHATANLVADGNGFISPFSLKAGLRVQSAEHPPLFALYLAAFSVLGVRSELGHALATCLLGVAAVVVVGLVGRRIAGDGVGLLAAGLLAVYPNAFTYDGQVLSESLTILLVAVSLLAGLRLVERRRPADAAVLGLVVGLAALARTEQLLLLAVLVAPVALLVARTARERVALVAVAALAAGVVVVPWVLYNRGRFERTVVVSSQAEVTLAAANCDTTYEGRLLGYWDIGCVAGRPEAAGYSQLGTDQSVLAALFRDQAVDYVEGHLSRVPAVVAARLGRSLGVFRPLQQDRIDQFVEGREKWNVVGGQAMFYVLVPLAVIGGWSLRRRRPVLVVLLAPVVAVLVTVALVYASTRFRAPAEVVLCLLGALGASRVAAAVGALRAESRASAPAAEPEPSLSAAG